ncbi:MAG: polyphosphate kinase [Candidatus Neomarinimicrobiota bacterium]|jgi:polyphosphate kinase 2|nr:polyphosphate kinase [Candidatus Neomarinimicrobiota bacterium]MEC7872715.1 polyphosphate kinase [Candidatus Neomarinimicrobiota bacterium]MEC9436808.1 polyphosphate kinase [Candidatus Neomarinimicrobiota bacterium]MED5248588.1 polyphosphate kinase [Candidatus Neomarinimicrobiota bacterium]MED5434256.1 polyphosphate kinase [Candidatus Neomarinimicrobiota bacterium]|tara:strand:- start:207 stop:1040 length:834 start_codon:yes stop_codon:yes gene_type:complete
MIIYNRTEYSELKDTQYRKEKRRLQIELLKLQEWAIETDQRVAILLEGRDAAGKGSTIKRFIENLMPKAAMIVELGVPNKKQEKNWFKTWEKRLPKRGTITFFDRSWYSRAIIQPAMGYCTENQYKYFMKKVNKWEKKLINKGFILIKIYLSISKENQKLRFQFRENHELKYWKLSSNDWKAHKNWQLLTDYKEQMFSRTSTELSPWVIINSDNKMIARLNAIRYVLSKIDYPGRKDLKPKKWSKDSPVYNISLFNVQFNNLSQEQYELLNSFKGHE